MMLQDHAAAQHFAKDRGGLVDDGGEGDGVNHPLVPMRLGVVERKSERGKCLPPAGRNGERE